MRVQATRDEATRSRLLDAAATVFSEAGFHAATIRQICAKAQVNVAAVNYHFRDKFGLYTAVLERSSGAEFQLKVRAAMSAAPSAEDALRIFVRGMFEKVYGEKPEANLKIMAREISDPTPALDVVVDRVIRPQYEQLCELVGHAIGSSSGSDTTRLCVHSLLGQVLHYAQARELIERIWPTLDIPQSRNRIADHIVRFTIAGLYATPQKKRVRK